MHPEYALYAAGITASVIALGLIVQTLLGLRALGVSRGVLQQKTAADAADAQWKRIEWAVNLTLAVDPYAQELGVAALRRLLQQGAVLDDADVTVIIKALEKAKATVEASLDDEPQWALQTGDDGDGVWVMVEREADQPTGSGQGPDDA